MEVEAFGRTNSIILGFAIILLVAVDVMQEKGICVLQRIYKQEIWFRGIMYTMILMLIIVFGVFGASYDASTFIYFQF